MTIASTNPATILLGNIADIRHFSESVQWDLCHSAIFYLDHERLLLQETLQNFDVESGFSEEAHQRYLDRVIIKIEQLEAHVGTMSRITQLAGWISGVTENNCTIS